MTLSASTTKTLIMNCLKSRQHKALLNCRNKNVHQIHFDARVANYYKFVRKSKDAEKGEKILSHSYLNQLLKNCKSVSEQLEVFDSYAKFTHEDISFRQSVCQNIENIFKPYFPECSVCFTGSSFSGLGLRGCDIDLSLRFSTDETDQHDASTKEYKSIYLKDVKEGTVSASDLSALPPKRALHLLQNVLFDSGYNKEARVLPGRCPILSFAYENTTCDLAVNNISAFQGSSLMLLCSKLDDRIAPLYRFVSYWAKHHRICGAPLKIKSYALFLLVVYFLQTRNPPILSSIEHMLDKTEFIEKSSSWSYDICKYIEKFESSKNSQSIEELLHEFFIFYAEFDYSNVICPLTSQLKKASEMFSKSDSDDDKFLVSAISIQDPLDLNWNVTCGVSWKYNRHFKKDLHLVHNVYQNEQLWKPSTDNWGLMLLLEDYHTLKSYEK
ncbi:speckle targeted PIP5K1A-regulated poly(A) polymerase [Trichonephila clavata]|uniref:Speckle targeted PIP5K1A-regulated poly(A) polymerase n=1 Tax=Trichonephila clavata TaxID=2740835 RepID=A0A8X6JHR9_TRICU|nr:speckle targeted PIP5K1A-regulated poly(A) polymerase [Trichonephila clavata]